MSYRQAYSWLDLPMGIEYDQKIGFTTLLPVDELMKRLDKLV